MKLVKLKIFDNLLMQYANVSGSDTWFDYSSVSKAYTQLLTVGNNSRFEVHEIVLTTVCRLEE